MHFNFRALLSALVLLTGLSSCSEDFNVMAPARPYTIVYGILDAGDPVNYVRIQRAFGNESQSALDLAKLPDSSYFPNITVTFSRVGSTTPETLFRVDMSTEGYTKAPGEFFTTPNYAYKITTPLTPGATYRLLIRNNDNGNVDTAETAIVDLNNTSISEFNTADPKLELTPTSSVNSDSDGSYTWRVINYPLSQTVKYMNAIIRFNFVERNLNSGAQTRKTFDYLFNSPIREALTTTTWSTRFPTSKFNNFYVGIINGLGAAPAGTERRVDSAAMVAYFGSQELYLFQQNQTNIGGLGGDQIQYRYTNIRGKSVIGIFASRGKLVRSGVPLTDRTIEELKNNANTKPANITGRFTP